MPKVIKFFALLAATVLAIFLCRWTGALPFNFQQSLSLLVFSTFIYGTLLYGEFRLAFAFGGIAALMGMSLLSVERFTQAASLDVLVFLIGTFLVIGYLEENHFFGHVVERLVGVIGPRPQTLLISLMMFASIASALVGEVTAILFMAGTLLHLTTRYKLNPIPFVIMLVFACNNGSSMSSVGNPIGVLIALKTGLSFTDFLIWAAPTAMVVNIATYFICRWWFADSFAQFAAAVKDEHEAIAAGDEQAIARAGGFTDPGNGKRNFADCWALLAGLVILLSTHGLSERWLGTMFHAVRDTVVADVATGHEETIEGLPTAVAGISVSSYSPDLIGKPLPDGRVIKGFVFGLKEGTMMVGAALLMGSIVLFLLRERARELVERRVDWWTLAFFMMLFASVGTLQDTHVTQVIATKIKGIGGGQMVTTQIVGWATGWLSAFLDNVLAVATFVPVVHDIRAASPEPYSSGIYWFMLFGGTFMGNMTIIGSTANIVAVGLLEKRGHGTVSFGYWMKIGFIVAVASMLIATGMIFVMQHIGMPTMPPPAGGAH